LKKTLNIRFCILYIGDKMSEQKAKKIRIGKGERKILEYLQKVGGSAWKSEILSTLSWSQKYDAIISRRLENMAKKGLITIRAEINPESGKSKLRVYLNQ